MVIFFNKFSKSIFLSKGWLFSNKELLKHKIHGGETKLALKYVVVLKNVFGEEANVKLPKLFNNDHYTIYKVDNKTKIATN